MNIKNMNIKDKVLFAINPTTFLISKGAEKAVEKVLNLSESATAQQMKEEAVRQNLIAEMRIAQAKVAQELAIAQRINTAETVEIVEHYDTSGKGGFNGELSESSISAGVSGEGRKVSHRTYRFTGWHDGASQVLQQRLEDADEDKQSSWGL